MGSFITAKELNGLPGITESNLRKVLNEINEAEKDDKPYILIEQAWPFMDKKQYHKAASWICLALQKGYSDGNAISGWLDDWKSAGQTDDLITLVKDPNNHQHAAQILAKHWQKEKGTEESGYSSTDSSVDDLD